MTPPEYRHLNRWGDKAFFYQIAILVGPPAVLWVMCAFRWLEVF